MRNLAAVAALLTAMGLAVPGPGALAQSEKVDGVVTKIDSTGGKITIRHGPLKKFDMDSMTMVFRVKELAMLKQVKVGDKIKFDADRINGQFTVISLEKAR